jgi:4-diphosphocytidyl-2-C-methyl-D-erythritol kinase
VNPSLHINTGWAFGQIAPQATGKNLDEIIKLEPKGWEENGLINDFEKPVFSAFPEIASIKDKLLKMGANYASMTGTGSTCYGIFETEPSANPHDFPNHYMVKKLKL